MIDEYTQREMLCKINAIIKFLIDNNGSEYLMYNRTCPAFSEEPDSDIVEYAQDIKNIINNLNKEDSDPFDDFPF